MSRPSAPTRPASAAPTLALLALLCAAPAAAQAGADSPSVKRAAARPFPGWHALTSAHVLLRTNLDLDEAQDVVVQIERMHALLVQALSLDPARADDRVEVYAFATRAELLEVTGAPEIAGQEETERRTGRQWILLGGRLSEYDQDVTIAHELAHALSFRVIPRQPKWFAEGLAQYLSSVALARADGARAVGALPSKSLARELARHRPTSVRDLLTWNGRGDDEGTRYATSWLLVRHLATRRADELAAFEQGLARGDSVAAAWTRSFPEWSTAAGLEKLDALLEAGAHDVSGGGTPVAAAAPAAPRVRARAMSAAEVYTFRLALPRTWKPGQLRAEVEAALREDPDHVAALTLLAADPFAPRRELGRRAVKAHPDDPDAWRLEARCSPPGPAREAALQKALALAPERQELRVELADAVAFADPAQAEELSRQAVEQIPWSGEARTVHALALSGVGRCTEAVVELQRGIDILHPEHGRRQTLLDDAAKQQLERHCAAPASLRADGLLRRAREADEDGQDEEALRLAGEAVAADPASLQGWDDRGALLLSLGRTGDAEASFRRQVMAVPGHATAWDGLAWALARQGRAKEAERALRKQLAISPEAPGAQLHLGEILLELRRPREAATVLERLAAGRRDDPDGLVTLAHAQLAAGQDAEGMDTLQRALKLRDTARTLNDAAYVLTLVGAHLDRAAEWLESSVQRSVAELQERADRAPESADAGASRTLLCAWDTLGWLRFRQGELEEAARWTAASLAGLPSAESARHLAEILQRKRAPAEEIQAAYALALVLEPTPELRARLRKLAGAAQVDAVVAQARTEIIRRRLLGRAPAPASAAVDRRVRLVLGPDGVVLDALPSGLDEADGARAVAGLRHAVPFPDPAPPRLVVAGRYRCADGTCSWFLGAEPVPPGPLPE